MWSDSSFCILLTGYIYRYSNGLQLQDGAAESFSISLNGIFYFSNTTATGNHFIMEVHHHTDPHHKKKQFTEYFLEFLMIFLAVTLGFLAENLREHITNHAKEKEYIRGFIRNVKDDTAVLKYVIHFDSVQVNGIDHFFAFAPCRYEPGQ